VKSDAFVVVVINENVRVEKIDAFASQKFSTFFAVESEKISAKKRPRRARRNVLKKRQKKTNASEKKAEKGEKNVPRGGRMTWMRMREHFLGKRAFLFLGMEEKNASTLCVINPSLYIA